MYFHKPVLCLLLISTVVMFLMPTNATAMPNFARKLGVECSFCHTTIPRLNELGYKFRAAGWRLPEDIGKDETKAFELGDYFAGRIQARYDGSRTTNGLVSSHKSQFTFHELTLYPVTGPFKKYYSSLVEMSFLPEESPEVENAYVRVDKGDQKQFFQFRFGVFHPFEGFGASDRPISIARPFFQTTAANFNQSTFFKPWGFDQAGAEVGYDYKRASVRATVFNGLMLREEDGVLKPFAAQGGLLTKSTSLPAASTPDLQVFGNYILHPDGGNLSAYYYHGNMDLQIPSATNFFRNKYDRVAFYAGYPLAKQLQVLGGYLYGRDHVATGSTFGSRGVFVEADAPVHKYVTPGIRYDWFDPATNKASNDLWGVTAYANVPLQNGFQLIAEYQHKDTHRGSSSDQKDDKFQVRLIFIQ